jgi:uncharacterized protein
MATVSALTYYPVKGCAGVTVNHASVTETGLVHDRSFVVVDDNYTLISQREVARLAVVRAQVIHDGHKLALSAPDVGDLIVDVIDDAARTEIAVHKWRGDGLDQGPDATAFFSEVLGTPARLMRAPDSIDRDGSGEHRGKVKYADSTALLITSLSSLDGLNSRILERGADPVPMNRFRPNIVATGWATPHTEDEVRRARIGSVEIGYGKKDIRCVVTMVDQLAGKRSGPEPLRTLATYRRDPDGGVAFGMKAAVLRPGEIFLGDEINVTEWA